MNDVDEENMPYEGIRKSLDTFTLDPNIKNKNIEKANSRNEYIFKNNEIGSFKFRLISDNVCNSIKDELLSNNRYGNCHHNVYKLASTFSKEEQSNISIVAGSFMINDKDSFNHSWLEMEKDDKTIVWDYNNNLIVDKNIYYKLYGIKKISKINLKKIVEITQLMDSTNIVFHPLEINCFGEEIYRDLMKNRKLLIKK